MNKLHPTSHTLPELTSPSWARGQWKVSKTVVIKLEGTDEEADAVLVQDDQGMVWQDMNNHQNRYPEPGPVMFWREKE